MYCRSEVQSVGSVIHTCFRKPTTQHGSGHNRAHRTPLIEIPQNQITSSSSWDEGITSILRLQAEPAHRHPTHYCPASAQIQTDCSQCRPKHTRNLITYHQESHHGHHQFHVSLPLALPAHLEWCPIHLVWQKAGTELWPATNTVSNSNHRKPSWLILLVWKHCMAVHIFWLFYPASENQIFDSTKASLVWKANRWLKVTTRWRSWVCSVILNHFNSWAKH